MILNGITKAFSLDRKELLNVKTQNMKKCHTVRFTAQSTKSGNLQRNKKYLPIMEEDNSQIIKS